MRRKKDPDVAARVSEPDPNSIHAHVYAYRGLEYEQGERMAPLSTRERIYWDVYFCQLCLEEKIVRRLIPGHVMCEGSTPRGGNEEA